MAKQVRQLKGNDIDNLFNQEFAPRKVVLSTNSNKEVKLEIQEKINDTAIMSLVGDLIDRSEYCRKNNIAFNPAMNTQFLLIKYFTNIEFKEHESLENQYPYEIDKIKKLIDIGLYDKIIGYFDEETMKRIEKTFREYIKQTKVITNNQMIDLLKEETDTEVEVISDEKEL